MAPKITDPNTFLHNLIAKKGKSELYGIYLTGVNVLAEAEIDYDYEVSGSLDKDIQALFAREQGDWNCLLVDLRRNREEIIHPISFIHRGDPVTIFFASEGTEMSCMIFIPSVTMAEFPYEVMFFQQLLKEVASFAGKTPTSLRFTLGAAYMDWEEAVDQGFAREVDYSL